jgi:hypothetical protein
MRDPMLISTMRFSLGQSVKLVSHDPEDYLPPVGAVGVIEGSDGDGDYDVLFPGHPCPVPPGRSWVVPGCQLAPAVYKTTDLRESAVA